MTRAHPPLEDEDPIFIRRSIRDILIVFAPALLITVAGFALAYQFVEPEPPRHITMATGPLDSAYHRVAQQYREVLQREGIELALVETAGSVENLQLLEQADGAVDLALVQGNAGTLKDTEGVESLGSVFYEPIWIFVHGTAPEIIPGLADKRIAIGPEGSGSNGVFQYLFELNAVDKGRGLLTEIGGITAQRALLNSDVDAAGFVSVYDNHFIETLLTTPGIELMPFFRAEAYQRKYHFLARVLLPRGVTDLEQDLPPKDVPLIALVTNLAARDGLHPALVTLLLSAAKEIHGHADLFSRDGQFPSTENVVLPMNKDADRFLTQGPPLLQRYLPFWLAIAVDRLSLLLIPLVTLLFPLFKVLPPTYRWRVRSRIFRYYRALLDVEVHLRSDPSSVEIERCRARLQKIEDKVGEVSVPIGYADTLYNMRLHLKLVQEKLEKIAVRRAAEQIENEHSPATDSTRQC